MIKNNEKYKNIVKQAVKEMQHVMVRGKRIGIRRVLVRGLGS